MGRKRQLNCLPVRNRLREFDRDTVGRATLITFASGMERSTTYDDGTDLVTYTYAADGRKRTEEDSSGVTTLVWDGGDYLQGRT